MNFSGYFCFEREIMTYWGEKSKQTHFIVVKATLKYINGSLMDPVATSQGDSLISVWCEGQKGEQLWDVRTRDESGVHWLEKLRYNQILMKMRPKHFGIITRETRSNMQKRRGKKKKVVLFSAQEEIHSCFILDRVNVKLPLGSFGRPHPPARPTLAYANRTKKKRRRFEQPWRSPPRPSTQEETDDRVIGRKKESDWVREGGREGGVEQQRRGQRSEEEELRKKIISGTNMALLVAVVETSAEEITPHLAHLSVILYSGTVIWLQSQINTL